MIDTALGALKRILPRKAVDALRPAYHFLLAYGAAIAYGLPSRRLTVIGVTGTKGKTTVVELLHSIFQEAGIKAASASSLRFRIGDEIEQNDRKMTMPGRFFMQRFLHRARRAGCRVAILEVTSEGIRQFRHRGIRFSVAVMTNIAPEHLESHGGMESYLRSKLDLFWRLDRSAVAVINADDAAAARFQAATEARCVLYSRGGIKDGSESIGVGDVEIKEEGVQFSLGGAAIVSPLAGNFSFYNILAAVAAAASRHVALDDIVAGVRRVALVPGRFETVQKEPFRVIVDYAHTPDSLRSIYEFARFSGTRTGKLICVLGAAGGGRDRWKRPEFGKIAAEFCDSAIATNEDPYDEDPAAIVEEVARGFAQAGSRRSEIRKILDRRSAIREAIRGAAAGDTLIITGKGAEPWIMGPGGARVPWDDRVVVREELKTAILKAP